MALTLLCMAANVDAQDTGQLPSPEARGVWMSREVLVGGPERMEQVFYRLAQAHFNRILIDVHYQGTTIYPSQVMAAVGAPVQRAEFVGRDPVQEAIDIGHRWGLEVTAWFEYGLMAHTNPTDTSDRGPILTAHPEWAAIRKNGSSVVSNENGFFHWLDPAHPEVVQFMEDLFAEVAQRYPGLDRLERDRIRYPSKEFTYSPEARARYMAETGGTDPLGIDAQHPEWWQWTQWREAQTTTLARRIYHRVKRLRPDLLVSAAVAPAYMLFAGDKLQAWNVWADSGYVDALEPMLYLPDSDLDNQLGLCLALLPPTFSLYPGIAYQGDASLLFQIAKVRERGCAGVTIWYYGSLREETLRMLAQSVFREPVKPPHKELIVDESDAHRFQCSGPWEMVPQGYRGGSLRLRAGTAGAVATWTAEVLREGLYELFARWPGDSSAASDVRYRVAAGGKEATCSLDQRANGDKWVFLLSDTLRYRQTIVVSLEGSAKGKVYADAIRLVRVGELVLDDLNVPDSTRIELKFSRAVQTESALRAASYAIDGGAQVLEAQPAFEDGTVIGLRVTPLVPHHVYTLHLLDVRDRAGNLCQTTAVTFSFSPDKAMVVVDDETATFRAFGDWRASSEGSGYHGAYYLLSPAGQGENRAQWWAEIQEDGLYEISVTVPAAGVPLAARVPYHILHHFGSDTLFLDQNLSQGGWCVLGRRHYRAKEFASVMVTNKASEGEVVADAMRIRRVLATPVREMAHRAPIPKPQLLANYPNPFNGATTLVLALPESGRIMGKVYNILGQEVDTVATSFLPAGLHKVLLELDGHPSGLYLCRLFCMPAGGEILPQAATRKLVLLR